MMKRVWLLHYYMEVMEKKIDILNELKEISEAVAAIERTNTYSVPESYFTHFPVTVLSMIAPEPVFLTRKDTYEVPEGYFDSLAENVLSIVKSSGQNEVYEELEELAPFLNTISKDMVYTAPEGYFDQLGYRVREEQTTQPAKIVLLKPVHSIRGYALAAAVMVVIAFSGYFLTPKTGDDSQAMNTATGHPAIKAVNRVDIKSEVARVSQDDIENFLKNSPSMYEGGYYVPGEDDIDINQLLDGAKDAELENYIKDMPSTSITDKNSTKQI